MSCSSAGIRIDASGTRTPVAGTKTPATDIGTPTSSSRTSATGTETPTSGTRTQLASISTPSANTRISGTGSRISSTGTRTPAKDTRTPVGSVRILPRTVAPPQFSLQMEGDWPSLTNEENEDEQKEGNKCVWNGETKVVNTGAKEREESEGKKVKEKREQSEITKHGTRVDRMPASEERKQDSREGRNAKKEEDITDNFEKSQNKEKRPRDRVLLDKSARQSSQPILRYCKEETSHKLPKQTSQDWRQENTSRDQRHDVSRVQRQDVSRDQRHDVSRVQRHDVSRVQGQDVSRVQRQDVSRDQRQDVSRGQRHDVSRVQRQNVSQDQRNDGSWDQGHNVSRDQRQDVSRDQRQDVGRDQREDDSSQFRRKTEGQKFPSKDKFKGDYRNLHKNRKIDTCKVDYRDYLDTFDKSKEPVGVEALVDPATHRISFAEALKKAKQEVKGEQEVEAGTNEKSLRLRAENRQRLRGKEASTVRQQRRNPNRISANDFNEIGQTSMDDEMYVMDTKSLGKADNIEVEFLPTINLEREDVLIEFVDPVLVDKFVNKISAGTYRRIGNTEDDKYVMSVRQQTSWSKIVEQPKPVEQPVLKDIHNMIKVKMKAQMELTPTEREVLRQKRRDRRRREKEQKQKVRDEESRLRMISNKGMKLGFISSTVLQQVTGSGFSPTKLVEERRGIKFQDEEYPQLAAVRANRRETVLHREVRNSTGSLVSNPTDTGSDWETDASEYTIDQDCLEEETEYQGGVDLDHPEVDENRKSAEGLEDPSGKPLSYSSILKTTKPKDKPAASSTPVSGQRKGIIDMKTENSPTETVKKKVKAKAPIEIDIFKSLLRKEPKVSKKASQKVLGGKIQREPEKKVRNQLDSSAPSRKRGKEREGGKKKKRSMMKKIILAEKAAKRFEREAAAERRSRRIKEGVRLKPLETMEDEEPHGAKPGHPGLEAVTERIERISVEVIDKKQSLVEMPTLGVERDVLPPEETLASRNNLQTKELTRENEAKQNLHSRKYRDYCDQDLSKDLDVYVTNLMSDLVRFQDRQHLKDPVKARARRRYAVGLRETTKFLKVKKVTCVVIAHDLEKISSDGGLDCAVHSIIKVCGEQSVPVVFSLGRYRLGRACLRKVPVSCIAIMNAQGSDENYKNMLELTAQLKESYAARLKIEIENLETVKSNTSSTVLRYTPGMEFIPRSTSLLRYCPGKDFYPRGYVEQPEHTGGDQLGATEEQLEYSYEQLNYWSPGVPYQSMNSYVGSTGSWIAPQPYYPQHPATFSTDGDTSQEVPHWQRMVNILKS